MDITAMRLDNKSSTVARNREYSQASRSNPKEKNMEQSSVGSAFNESQFSDASSDIVPEVKGVTQVNVRRLETHVIR